MSFSNSAEAARQAEMVLVMALQWAACKLASERDLPVCSLTLHPATLVKETLKNDYLHCKRRAVHRTRAINVRKRAAVSFSDGNA